MYRTQPKREDQIGKPLQQEQMPQKYLFGPQPNYTINYNNNSNSWQSKIPLQSGSNYYNSKLTSADKSAAYQKYKEQAAQSYQNNSQQKFMKHLLNMNSVSENFNSKFDSVLKQDSNKSYEQIFIQKMKGYQTLEVTNKNATSVVDHIIQTLESSNLNKLGSSSTKEIVELRFIKKPTIVPLDNKIRNKVIQVNEFFTHNKNLVQNQRQQIVVGAYASYKSQVSQEKSIINQKLDQIDIYDLENYAQVLKYFPALNTKEKIKNKQEGSLQANSRKKQFPDMSSVQLRMQNASPGSNKGGQLRKIDILLIQILREKKRKGLVEDYFSVMQMKLVQLLQHILQDQPQYHNPNWTLAQRMKEILKNLQSFKGKNIDGQSKVNLLRIFFEEFRNLKQQREEKQAKKHAKTNKKQLFKKEQSSQRHFQRDNDTAKQSSKKSKNLSNQNQKGQNQRGNPLIKNDQKLKTRINYHQTMSMGSNKQKKIQNINQKGRKLQTKSVRQDQWIGDPV